LIGRTTFTPVGGDGDSPTRQETPEWRTRRPPGAGERAGVRQPCRRLSPSLAVGVDPSLPAVDGDPGAGCHVQDRGMAGRERLACAAMGRIFETRKATMFKRWDRMAKAFTRIGKEIAIAVKAGGPTPESNPALRRVMQNARAANMPKDKVEAAIKKASGQNQVSYETVMYEGYGPHGIAVLVETATDNVVRTVANVRMHFKNHGGNMGNTGSVGFLFDHLGVFRLPMPAPSVNLEELELDLINFGLEEMGEATNDKGEKQLVIRCAFNEFGTMQKTLEERGLAVSSAESEYIAKTLLERPEDQAKELLEMVDALEQDEDVQRVFHNLA
jgi:YebC/PmpR family DNA-binding regulatory protein